MTGRAHLASGTGAKLTTEALLHELMEPIAKGLELDPVDDLTNKRKLQQELCLVLVDATSAACRTWRHR